MSRTLRMISTLAALAAVVALGAPSMAAKPPKGGGGGGTTQTGSSIAIDTVTNADGTTAKTDGAIQPSLGSKMTFRTSVQPLAGWQYPMVTVACYQDVNKDGTIEKSTIGPDLVYLQLDQPDTTFVLGGGWSQWLDRGGSAICEANLWAYPGLHKGDIIWLAGTDPQYWAAGA
jgi:hypothetical protein